MSKLQVTLATEAHYQYFKKEVIEEQGGYIVSDHNSIAGLFSFTKQGDYSLCSFTFVFNQEAIKLAMDTYLENNPEINMILYKGNQNLTRVGFVKEMDGYKYYRKQG